MKTAIKLTAIAVITALIALACSDPATLTKRNYKERNESKDAKYTNSPGESGLPTIFTSLNYWATPATVSDADKESTIYFPDNADVLKADNASIEASLKEFLTLSQYTNPPTAFLPTPNLWTPSTLTTPVNYTFVRREGNNIIVIVDVPNIDFIVAKVDASKYKYFGKTLDTDGDGVVDEYDDYYEEIQIIGSTKNITDGGAAAYPNFVGPVASASINISISGPSGGSFTTATTMPQLFTISNSWGSGANNAYMRKILSDILPNIQIQKYDQASNTWVADGTVALYDSTTTAPTGSGFTTDLVYGSFTPVDLGIYRVTATNLANLKTKDAYGATGKPAKIKINSESYLKNTIYTNPVSYYNTSVRQWVDTNPIESVVVKSDSNKKNVVLDVFFDPITDNIASPSVVAWLETLTTEEFNKNFKLVYDGENSSDQIPTNANLIDYTNIVELKVTNVVYSASKYYDTNNTKTNCITITLDPSYQIKGNRSIAFLITTGFKYGGGHVTFGTNSLDGSYYKGSYFWRSYGVGSVMTDPGRPYMPPTGGWWWDDDNDPFTSEVQYSTDYNGGVNPDSSKTGGHWIQTSPGQTFIPPTYASLLNL